MREVMRAKSRPCPRMPAVLPVLMILLFLAMAMPSCSASGLAWNEEPWNETAPNASQEEVAVLQDLHPFNLSANQPSYLRIGPRDVPFSEYASAVRSSDLWIVNGSIWCQYVTVPQGEELHLVAYSATSGAADLYLVSYAASRIDHRSYTLQPGYHSLPMKALSEGRMMLILAMNNQPGNALIIDVLPRPPGGPQGPVDVTTLLPGRALVIIRSESFRGYDVYVDGTFMSSDISDGVLDGVASFTLSGDKTHSIVISRRDSQGNIINRSEHTKSFKRDTAYTLDIS